MAKRTETQLDDQLVPFFRRVALILLSISGLIILLGNFDVDVSAFITTLGIGSLAIALAAQAALSDTISGFVIMVDRPFRIGDRIEIQELATWGDVVDIGLRSSHIRTRDNRMVIVPNSIMGKSLIVNHSYPDTQYRIQVHLGVAYGSDLELARQTMIEAVRGVDGVLDSHPVEALFLEFGDSALIFRVRWWIESYIDTRRMFDRVNTSIYRDLNAAGIGIPFPQRDVHHKIDLGDARQIANVLARPEH
jgi:small-conductance mechanosensitive channel